MTAKFAGALCILCAACGLYAAGEGRPLKEGSFNAVEMFKNPPNGYGEVPFYWWMGDKLDKSHLIWHLDILKGKGVQSLQVNYAHSDKGGESWGLTYQTEPPLMSDAWWELFAWFKNQANARGMTVSLSDYTLGVGQGQFVDRALAENPDLGASQLVVVKQVFDGGLARGFPLGLPICAAVYALTDDGEPIASTRELVTSQIGGNGILELKRNGSHMLCYVYARAAKNSFDPSNPDSGRLYVKHFFGEFEKRLGGSDGLNFFFSDELNFNLRGNVWSPYLRDEFKRRKGYDVSDYLDLLFMDSENAPLAAKIKLDYNDVFVSLSEENFFKPVFDWHEQRGLVYGCDHGGRGRRVDEFGDYFRTQSWNQAPGCDQPRGASDLIKNKVASSIAHMYSRPRVWLEGFYASGWGQTSAHLLNAIFSNYAMGQNLLSLHGLYYSTLGGWWEWAPPCNHFHQPYWAEMPALLKCVERLSFLMSQGAHCADVAVMYPVEPKVAGFGDSSVKAAFKLGEALYSEGIDFDFADARSIERAEFSGGKIRIADEAFEVLIIPAMQAMRMSTLQKLSSLANAGARIWFLGFAPVASDYSEEIASASAASAASAADSGVVSGAASQGGVSSAPAGSAAPADSGARGALETAEVSSVQAAAQTVAQASSASGSAALPSGANLGADSAGGDSGGAPGNGVSADSQQSFAFDMVREEILKNTQNVLVFASVSDIVAAAGSAFEPDFNVVSVKPASQRKVAADSKPKPAPKFMHRRINGEDFYFVYNLPKGTECSFRATGAVTLLDPFSGEESRVKILSQNSARTRLRLPLSAYDFHIFRFDKSRRPVVEVMGDSRADDVRVAVAPLDGKWSFSLKPVLDNSRGDYIWPASNELLSAQIRFLRPSQFGAELPSPPPPSLASFPEEQTRNLEQIGYSTKFNVLGPLSEPLSDEDVLTAQTRRSGEFSPLKISMRYGVLGDVGHQGYHGLKGEISDNFIRLGAIRKAMTAYKRVADPAGKYYYLFTKVYAPRDGAFKILSGGVKPAQVFVNGVSIDPSSAEAALKAGANDLILRYDKHCETYFAFADASAEGYYTYALQERPLSSKWNGMKSLLHFDASTDFFEPLSFEFESAPALDEFRFFAFGDGVKVYIDGQPARVSQLGVREDGLRAYRAKTPKFAKGVSRVRIDIARPLPGFGGGAAIPYYIRQICGVGEIEPGSWSKLEGLRCYSGGAIYSKKFKLPHGAFGKKIVLNLGSVGCVARVSVNGHDAGVRFSPPWTFDISKLVRITENTLEITVYNTAANHYLSVPTSYRGSVASGILGSPRLDIFVPARR